MHKKHHSTLSFIVKTTTTLLPFVMQALDGISRNRAKAILTGGGVSVNNSISKQFDTELLPGMRVDIQRSKPKTILQSKFVRIVYEDRHIIVIDKQPGILSMANSVRSFCVKTILDAYFNKTNQKCKAHIIHRLDRETSGLLVYAKSIEAEQILEHNWRDMVTDRRYIALVSGKMSVLKGEVKSWLKDNKAYITYSSPTNNGGKYAVTHFETIKRTDDYSLVRLKLETGRKNQIRVHLQDLGHPVCGDLKYGDGNNPINRLALHAFRLHFIHPITREHLKFETPIPKSFNSVFSKSNKE